MSTDPRDPINTPPDGPLPNDPSRDPTLDPGRSGIPDPGHPDLPGGEPLITDPDRDGFEQDPSRDTRHDPLAPDQTLPE